MLVVFIFAVFVNFNPAQAAIRILPFSAQLKNATGETVVPDGTYAVTFRIYTQESGGTALWEETHSVGVTNGIVAVNLGSVTTIPSSLTFNSGNFYLGVQVGSDAEMSPRKQIGAVPAAFNAETLDGSLAGTGANNILKLDGSGNISIAGNIQAGTSTLSGLTVDSTTLSVDSGNDRVGVGTITPGYALDVAGDVNASGEFKIGGVTVCTSSGCAGSGGAASYVQGGNSFGALAVLGTNDNNALAFETNNTERMRIDTSGNIGIGTAPSASFQLNLLAAADGVRVTTDNTPRDALTIAKPGDAGRAWLRMNQGTSDYRLGIGSSPYNLSLFYGLSATTSSPGTEILTITTGGNIGIGATSNIDSKLTLPASTTAAGGILFGTDTNLYRSAANQLRTDDNFRGMGTAVFGTTNTLHLNPDFSATDEISTGSLINSSGSTALTLRAGDGSLGAKVMVSYFSSNSATNLSAVEVSNTSSAFGNLLLMKSGGNVGIGTISPASALHVVGGATPGVFGIQIQSNTTNATAKDGRIKVGHYTNAEEPITLAIMDAQAAANILQIGGASSVENAATQIRLFTGATNTTLTGTERLRVDENGLVGIGATSLAYKLEVRGTANDVTSGSLRVTNPTDGTGAAGILSFSSGTSNASSGFVGAFSSAYTANAFQTDRIALVTNSDASGINLYAGSAGQDIRMYTGGGNERLRIDSGGNVGIGATAAAGTRLQVTGGDTLLGAGTFNNASGSEDLYVTGNIETDGTIFGNIAGTINPGFTVGSAIFQGASGLAQDNSNFFWDDTNNRLGIGTTAPDTRIEVRDGSAAYWNQSTPGTWGVASTVTPSQALTITNSAAGGYDPVLLFRQATSTGILKTSGAIDMLGRGAWTNGSNSTQISDMLFITRDNADTLQERMRITSNGNIGIGSASPSYKLTVAQDINATTGGGGHDTGQLVVNGSTNANEGTVIGFDTTDNYGWISAREVGSAARDLNLQPIGGNVGIGTTAPGVQLHIQGDGANNARLAIDQTASGGNRWDLISATNSLHGVTSGSLLFWNNNQSQVRLAIESGGNVGVGIAIPTAKLHVVGTVRSDGNDAATVFTSHNSSAGGTPQQFQILHNLGFTELKNLRGGIGILPSSSNNIGLGTNQPNWPVHILAGGTAQLMTIQNTATSTGVGVILRDGAGTSRYNFLVGANYNVSDAFEITPSTAADGTTFSTPALRVARTGHVAINATTSTIYQLRVAQDKDPAGNHDEGQLAIIGSGNNNEGTIVGFDTTDNYGYLQARELGVNARVLSLNPSGGNVAIGTVANINSKLTFADHTTAAGGILFGTDTNLYRAAADVLRSDDAMYTQRADANDVGFLSYLTGDVAGRINIKAGGEVGWGPGNAAQDTNLYRSAADTLRTDDAFIAGSLNGLTVSSGTVSSGTWDGTAITAVKGGTGQTGYTTGDILYASSTTALSKLAIGSDGECLTITSGLPDWGSCGGGAASGWTDDGTTVRLDTDTDSVGIGTVSPGAALGVVSTLTGSSGTEFGMKLQPTINQTGSAAYTALFVDATQTGTGSGAKLLADFQVGGVSQVKIDNAGLITFKTATAATTGLLWGTDTNLYRSAANTIRTDDSLNVALNFTLAGRKILTPSATQTLTAGSAISPDAAIVRVAGSGGAVTLTATPSVTTASIQDGQTVMIEGTNNTNTITVQDHDTLAGSNVHLGAATRVLGLGDILVLMYDNNQGRWYEVSFNNN